MERAGKAAENTFSSSEPLRAENSRLNFPSFLREHVLNSQETWIPTNPFPVAVAQALLPSMTIQISGLLLVNEIEKGSVSVEDSAKRGEGHASLPCGWLGVNKVLAFSQNTGGCSAIFVRMKASRINSVQTRGVVKTS